MKLLVICLFLFSAIITLGVCCRANLMDFCESAKSALYNAELALWDGDIESAAGFLDDSETLCDDNKSLLFVYLNHIHYEELVEKLARAQTCARAGDIPSALSEISSLQSRLDDLYEFDKITIGNIF